MTTATPATFNKVTTPSLSVSEFSLRNRELFESRCKGGFNEKPRSKLRGIEHPSPNSFRGKPRGIEPEGIKKTVTLRSYDIRKPFQRLYWVDARFLYDIGQIAPRTISDSADLPSIFSTVNSIIADANKEVTDLKEQIVKKQAACKGFSRAEYDNPLVEEIRIISLPCRDLATLYETLDGLVADNDGLLYCGGCSVQEHDDALKALLKILSRLSSHLTSVHQKFIQLLIAARKVGQPLQGAELEPATVKLSVVAA